jgi:hypothetical protein
MQNTTTLHNVDFAKLTKTLESCQTPDHLGTTRKMYRNFEKKWSNKISRPEMMEYMTQFLSLYKEVNQMLRTESINMINS